MSQILCSLLLFYVLNFGGNFLKDVEELIRSGQPQEALVILEEKLPDLRGRKRAKALYLATLASYKTQDWRKVLQFSSEFEANYEHSDKLPEVYFYHARALQELGFKNEAVSVFYDAYELGIGWVKDSAEILMRRLIGARQNLWELMKATGMLGLRIRPTNKIAVIVPQSGKLQPLGADFIRGITLAISSEVDMDIYDTRSDPAVAESIAQSIVDSNYFMVIGPLTSRSARRVAAVLGPKGQFHLIPAASDLKLADYGDFVVPFNYIWREEVYELVNFAMDSLKFSRFILIYPHGAIYRASVELFESVVKAKGGIVLEKVEFPESGLSFDKEISIVQELYGDTVALFVPGGGRSAFAFVTQLRFYGIDPVVLGCDEWLRWASKADVRMVVAAPIPGKEHVKFKDFSDKFFEAFDAQPTTMAELGYDAGVIVNILLDDDHELSTLSAITRADSVGIFRGLSGNVLLTKFRKIIKLFTYGRIEPIKTQEE